MFEEIGNWFSSMADSVMSIFSSDDAADTSSDFTPDGGYGGGGDSATDYSGFDIGTGDSLGFGSLFGDSDTTKSTDSSAQALAASARSEAPIGERVRDAELQKQQNQPAQKGGGKEDINSLSQFFKNNAALTMLAGGMLSGVAKAYDSNQNRKMKEKELSLVQQMQQQKITNMGVPKVSLGVNHGASPFKGGAAPQFSAPRAPGLLGSA